VQHCWGATSIQVQRREWDCVWITKSNHT